MILDDHYTHCIPTVLTVHASVPTREFLKQGCTKGCNELGLGSKSGGNCDVLIHIANSMTLSLDGKWMGDESNWIPTMHIISYRLQG